MATSGGMGYSSVSRWHGWRQEAGGADCIAMGVEEVSLALCPYHPTRRTLGQKEDSKKDHAEVLLANSVQGCG